MKHNLRLLALLCLCLALTACSQATNLPEWLLEEAAKEPVQQFEAMYTADGTLTSAYYCIPDGNGGTLKYSYHPGKALEQTAADGSIDNSVLTMKELPGLVETMKEWLLENEPGNEFDIAYQTARFSFLEDTEYPMEKISISLETQEMRALEGEYDGSKEYGALIISVGPPAKDELGSKLYAYSLKYMVYIDD